MDRKVASSEEFVGEFWLEKPAKHAIQGEFSDAERPVAIGFSQSDFGLVVQALDDAAGELIFGPSSPPNSRRSLRSVLAYWRIAPVSLDCSVAIRKSVHCSADAGRGRKPT